MDKMIRVDEKTHNQLKNFMHQKRFDSLDQTICALLKMNDYYVMKYKYEDWSDWCDKQKK